MSAPFEDVGPLCWSCNAPEDASPLFECKGCDWKFCAGCLTDGKCLACRTADDYMRSIDAAYEKNRGANGADAKESK